MRRPARIDLWFLPLDVLPDLRRKHLALLTVDERQRAGRFLKPGDRYRWISARAQLRLKISEHVSAAPESLRFGTDAAGRPFLVGAPFSAFDFNLSHAGDWALLALSNGVRTGADIEAQRIIDDGDAAFALSETEYAALQRRSGNSRIAAFFHYWTLKEAFLKARGTGLQTPLQSFGMSDDTSTPPRLDHWQGHDAERAYWHFETLTPFPGYTASVAAVSQERPVFHWHSPCISPVRLEARANFP